ncbi:MAG: hypothetical protein ACTSWY_12670 [Promethearchaeota archaeon]
MSINPNFEINEYMSIFLKFIMDLFIDSSDDISEILVFKSENIVYKSEWKDSNMIYNLADKWKASDVPSIFTLNNAKFIKLHISPYNLIYRSIKGQNALIGTKFQMNTEVISIYAIVKKTEIMQLGLTAMKDTIISIIELGQKMSDIVVKDSNNLQIGIRFPENKQIIYSLIESLKILQFVCEYTDKGDSIKLNFKYKRKEKKMYPDYMYK